MDHKKITIVTPNLNGARYLEKTINSVLQQGYPNLEYIVVDGMSTDGSLDIINKYRSKISKVIREDDGGHTDAVNRGFAASTGELMGWINSDDILLPGALFAVNEIFRTVPDVAWITGRATAMTEQDIIYTVREARPWSWLRFLCGDYRHIQQESTFWTRDLWNRAGGRLSQEAGVAADFELWTRFFLEANLHSVDVLLGSFRFRPGQLSREHADKYEQTAQSCIRRLWSEIPIPVLSEFSSTLTYSYEIDSSIDYASIHADLRAADPAILAADLTTKKFKRTGRDTLHFSGYSPHHHHLMNATDQIFDGQRKLIWKDGPALSGNRHLLGLDIELDSKTEPLVDPNIRTDTAPPMPLLFGPVVMYDFGSRYVVQLKGSPDHYAEIPYSGPTRIRVVFGPQQGLIVIANGNVITRLPTYRAGEHVTALPQPGCGYQERYWTGRILRFDVCLSEHTSRHLC